MTKINTITINDEVVYYVQDAERILVSLNAINIIFGSIEKDINDQIESNAVIIENEKFCDYNVILNLSEKYPVKNVQIINKIQTIKHEKFKFIENDQMYSKPIKNIYYAIDNKCCLKIKYENNNERIVEPHSIGIMKNGEISLFAYQISGYSKSGINSNPFRMFLLNKIYNIEILENKHFTIRWNKNECYNIKRFAYEIKRVK